MHNRGGPVCDSEAQSPIFNQDVNIMDPEEKKEK